MMSTRGEDNQESRIRQPPTDCVAERMSQNIIDATDVDYKHADREASDKTMEQSNPSGKQRCAFGMDSEAESTRGQYVQVFLSQNVL